MGTITERSIATLNPRSPEEIKSLADLVEQEEPVVFKLSKEEFLTLRLHVVYRFIQGQIREHYKKVKRLLTYLDIGVWTGIYQEYLTALEELAIIYGIDVKEKRVGQTASRDELTPHIISGRLRIFRQDGTNMKHLEGVKVDGISAIEVAVGMNKGQEVPLIRQMLDHLKDDGIAFITFDDEDSNLSEGPTWTKGGAVYAQEYIEGVVGEQSSYTARVEWFGQLMKERAIDGRAIMPFNKERGFYEVSSHSLRVQKIPFDDSNSPILKPMSWIGVIHKNSLQ